MARIIMLTTRLPYPPREGHQLRAWHLLRALAGAHEVTLLSALRRDDAPDRCAPLRAIVSDVEMFPISAEQSRGAWLRAGAAGLIGRRPFVVEKYFSAAMAGRLAELAPAADLLHVDMLPLMAVADSVAHGLPVILDAHNVEHLLLQQRAAVEPHWLRRAALRTQVAKLRRFERDACRRADRILACSPDDAAHLSQLAPDTPVCVVPNGVDVDAVHPAPATVASAARLLFVGQMGWFPNRDGMQWFLDEIFPRILAARPDVMLDVVGKNEGLRVGAAVRESTVLRGFVDDLGAAAAAAAVYVVPLRSGSGTRLKVLEAMAYGKAIVTTPIGAEGIELQHGSEALFAGDAAGFADAVLALLADPARAARLGAAARARAQAQYDWRPIGRRLLATCDELLAARAPAVAPLAVSCAS